MVPTTSQMTMSTTLITAPVIFGSGYATLGEWWKTGAVMSVVLIVIWLVVGTTWWRVLGYW